MHRTAWTCPNREQGAPAAVRIIPLETGETVADGSQNPAPRGAYHTVGTSFCLRA